MTQFVSDREIYERVIRDAVPRAARRVWIATADIKDLYVEASPGSDRMVPFVQVLAGMIERGVEVRLIHAKEPGPNFRADFDRFPILWTNLERVLCPREPHRRRDGREVFPAPQLRERRLDRRPRARPRAGGAVRRRLARRALPPLRTQGALRRPGGMTR